MRSSAFTLIELLVVVAIIAILAAMLFPVISRAVTKARQAACVSNLKNISMALAIYASDYEDRLPRTRGSNVLWYHVIFPYIRSYAIFYCPVLKDEGPGYGMNWLCDGLALANVWDVSSVIIIGDVRPAAIGASMYWPAAGPDPREWWINDANNDLCRAPDDNSFTSAPGGPYIQRHNGGICYGYLDGHVKWSPEQLVDKECYWVPQAGMEFATR